MFRILLLIFALKNITFGACYDPCDMFAQQRENIAESTITASYQGLETALDTVGTSYQGYLKALKEQNKKLEQIIQVRKHNSIKMKEINFLLSKLIQQKDIQIDINLQKDILKFQKSLINTKDLK